MPVVHTRQTIDHRSRAQRWRDAAAEVTVLQAQYWLEALPSSLQESATAEALQAICELELARSSGHRAPARVRPRLTAFAVALQMQLICEDRKSNLLAILPLTGPPSYKGVEERIPQALRNRVMPSA